MERIYTHYTPDASVDTACLRPSILYVCDECGAYTTLDYVHSACDGCRSRTRSVHAITAVICPECSETVDELGYGAHEAAHAASRG